jgi:hypothetical protein
MHCCCSRAITMYHYDALIMVVIHDALYAILCLFQLGFLTIEAFE